MKKLIKNRLSFLSLLVLLLVNCKKENVDKKESCVDPKLLTDAKWYPDKNYDYFYVKYYVGDTEGGVSYAFNQMYPDSWRLDCNHLYIKSRFLDAKGYLITSLTKSLFQYDDNGLKTFYNPSEDRNGYINIKSDLGDFNLNIIEGKDGGVNTIDNKKSILLARVNDKFSQSSIGITITETDVDNIIYPHLVANTNFTIRAGYYNYEGDKAESNLTLTEFKNDTLKGTFNAKMLVNRQLSTPSINPDIFNITEGTFAMKMYRSF